MMATLLLRFAAPMQSWGTTSKFNTRTTDREPSKSAVIGMIAASMGRGREESINDLVSLKFGVRVDQEGSVQKDFHTAHHPTNEKLAFVTERYYLNDAVFLVGLEGEVSTLAEIDKCLRNPAYPLYLGRRSCPPTGRISLGIRDMSLIKALELEPWLASDWYKQKMPAKLSLEIIYDAQDNESGIYIRDCPISFSQYRRAYGVRKVVHEIEGKIIKNENSKQHEKHSNTDHDIVSEITGE